MAETYRHGIYIQEESTALTPMTTVGNPTVIIGTAFKGRANEPYLCQTYSDFVEEFGFSGDMASYTLEEAAYVFFKVYNVKPIICINVLDVTKHKKAGTKTLSGTTNAIEITGPINLSSVVVKSGTETLVLGSDYRLTQANLKLTITIIRQTKIVDDTIVVEYNESDPTAVTKADILGTTIDGLESGIMTLENVYPRLGMIPSLIICPKWSTDPEVALAMAAQARAVNETFKAVAFADIDMPTTYFSEENPTGDRLVQDKGIARAEILTAGRLSSTNYQDLYEYKTANALQDDYLALFWPKVQVGEQSHWLSTHAAALSNLVDSGNDDIPFESASNKGLRISGTVLADGTALTLSKPKANTINGWGIITALNWAGWRLWGSRMSVYPIDDDPKNSWLPVRRMFNYLTGVMAINYFSRIDAPIRKRMIDQVVDEVQMYLNALTKRGALLGGRIAFLEEENPPQNLIDGRIKFHLYIGALIPARTIEFVLEYDVSYLDELFA